MIVFSDAAFIACLAYWLKWSTHLRKDSSTFTAIITIVISASLFFFSSPPKSYYQSLFLSPSLSNNASISNHLFILKHRPHVAGSQANMEAASYVMSTLSSNNIKTHLATYKVSLAYPESRSLTLIRGPQPGESNSFELRQEIYEGDPYANVADQVLPSFHTYAKSGSVTGPVAYVNYGQVEDYVTLKQMGVNLLGTVVLARYGKIYRGGIVQNAYEEGAIGVLIYSDRKDYGVGAGGEDAKWFLDGRWLPPSGFQVGSIYNGASYPVYHSMYDDFIWMKKFGDPMFHCHIAVASIWGLVALRIADEEILPFNYLSYACELQTVEENKGWASMWQKEPWKVRELNDRLMMAERAFTNREGLAGRPWYKHLVYAPSNHNDYGSKSFPGVDEAIEKAESINTTESWDSVQHEIGRVSRAITQASLVLTGELT